MKNIVSPKVAALCLAVAGAFTALSAQAQSFTLRVPAPGMKPAPAAVQAAKWTVTSATPVQFSDTTVGTTATATMTLQNTGNAVGTLASLTTTGRYAADFAAYPSCTNVAVNASCTVNLTFTPSKVGADGAAVTIGDTTVGLNGNGLGAPTDPYYSNVILQMHFDGAAGSSALVAQKGPTPTGSATVAGGTYAYVGSGSMKLVESDSVSFPGSSTFMLNGDYTIEYWFLPSALPSSGGNLVFKQVAGSYPGYGTSVTPSGASAVQLEVWFGNGVNGSTAGLSHPKFTVPVGSWYHFVQEIIGGEKRVYINGKKLFTGPSGQIDSQGGGTVVIATGLPGYMDELRITKGVGRYDADFTPSRTISPNQ